MTSIPQDHYSLWPLSLASYLYLPASIASWSLFSMTCILITFILQNLDLPMNYSLHSLFTMWPLSPMNSIYTPRLISYKIPFLHDFYTPLPLLPMISVHQEFILESFYNPWSLSSMNSISLTSPPTLDLYPPCHLYSLTSF